MSNNNFNNKKNSNIEADLNTVRNIDQPKQQQIEDTTDNNSSTLNNGQFKMLFDKSHEETMMMYENINERINRFQKQIINNNIGILNKYTETYNTINKNIIDNITNRTNFINKDVIQNIESFYKSIEITQRYFNDTIENYFNYIRN